MFLDLRQGVEAEAQFHYGNLSAYVNYAFVTQPTNAASLSSQTIHSPTRMEIYL